MECEFLDELIDGRFYVEKGACTRPQIKRLEDLDFRLQVLLHEVFSESVRAHYGGVYWGAAFQSDRTVAHTQGRMMYFNAHYRRRTSYELFLDVCHEYAHVETRNEDDAEPHDAAFCTELEYIVGRFMPSFFSFLLRNNGN